LQSLLATFQPGELPPLTLWTLCAATDAQRIGANDASMQ
jgi:hypothetical protein